MGYGCYELNGRDQGYNVPAVCDHPECDVEIDRGMGYSCGGDPQSNCGLFFCDSHRGHFRDIPDDELTSTDYDICERCADEDASAFTPSPDTREWIDHKLTDPSWEGFRTKNPKFVTDNTQGEL